MVRVGSSGGQNEDEGTLLPFERGKGGRPSVPEFDPWSTEDTQKYSEDHFYTRSTNKHDHSAEGRFRLPPQVYGRIQELIDSKHFPRYRSTSDFFRDAAIHRLVYLNGLVGNGDTTKALTLEMRLCRVEQTGIEMESIEGLIDRHQEQLEKAAKVRDQRRLSRLIGFLEDDLETLEEPYRTTLAKVGEVYRSQLKRMEGME